jgi:hypothetical protein
MWLIRTAVGFVKTVSHASLQRNCLTLGVQVRLAADQSGPISRLIQGQGGTYSTADELALASCDGKEDLLLRLDRGF